MQPKVKVISNVRSYKSPSMKCAGTDEVFVLLSLVTRSTIQCHEIRPVKTSAGRVRSTIRDPQSKPSLWRPPFSIQL